MEELITVIINVYNGEKYIKKCLECIINQTYKNLEILIVNDGSTDNTLSICENNKDERIRIITTKNLGLSLSRNIGIENAKGEYLYFIDADDLVEKDVIKYLYNLCKNYKTKISTCRCKDVYDYNFSIKNKKEKIKIITNKEMLKKILLGTDRQETIWNKLIKRELFNEIRFENRITDDIVVTYKLALATDKIVYSNKIKYYYLINKDSLTIKNKENLSKCIDKYKASFERYNYIKNIYQKFIENEIGILRVITMLYARKNKELHIFLDNEKSNKIFNELFSLKVTTSKIKLGEKIKILLFRINPQLSAYITRKYQNIKHKYKYKM